MHTSNENHLSASSFAGNEGMHLTEMHISTDEICAKYVFSLNKNYPKGLRMNSGLLRRSLSGSYSSLKEKRETDLPN